MAAFALDVALAFVVAVLAVLALLFVVVVVLLLHLLLLPLGGAAAALPAAAEVVLAVAAAAAADTPANTALRGRTYVDNFRQNRSGARALCPAWHREE